MSRVVKEDRNPELRDIISDSTDIVESTQLYGEAVQRFTRDASGKLSWGSGSSAVDANLARSGAAALTLTGALTISSGLTVTGAITAGAGLSVTTAFFPTVACTSLTQGSEQIPVAGSVYYSALWIPANYTITGAAVLNGATVGTDKWILALYNSAGTKVANSALAGVTTSGADTFQQIAFTATYSALGPGLYYLSVSSNGTTDTFRRGVVNGQRAGSATGVFGTLAAITPPTAAAAPMIGYVY